MKKRLFIDMDGVLADFMGAAISHPSYKNGTKELDGLDIFENLIPIPKMISPSVFILPPF